MHAMNPCVSDMAVVRQPNELDLRRIARSLERRSRYQYVLPMVEATPCGYRIVSACCSRNIESGDGIIDIAMFEFDHASGVWTLHRKDHRLDTWHVHVRAERLDHLTTYLNEDPERVFWQ